MFMVNFNCTDICTKNIIYGENYRRDTITFDKSRVYFEIRDYTEILISISKTKTTAKK